MTFSISFSHKMFCFCVLNQMSASRSLMVALKQLNQLQNIWKNKFHFKHKNRISYLILKKIKIKKLNSFQWHQHESLQNAFDSDVRIGRSALHEKWSDSFECFFGEYTFNDCFALPALCCLLLDGMGKIKYVHASFTYERKPHVDSFDASKMFANYYYNKTYEMNNSFLFLDENFNHSLFPFSSFNVFILAFDAVTDVRFVWMDKRKHRVIYIHKIFYFFEDNIRSNHINCLRKQEMSDEAKRNERKLMNSDDHIYSLTFIER